MNPLDRLALHFSRSAPHPENQPPAQFPITDQKIYVSTPQILAGAAASEEPREFMSSAKSAHRRGKLPEKSSSFHGKPSQAMATRQQLRRPSTQPDLLATNSFIVSSSSAEKNSPPPQPAKLLLNVSVLGSFGPVHVVMSMEATVGDLIGSAVRQYVKEGRRPALPTTDPAGFDLHYSQFCLECLNREEKLVKMWSRNFLLCPKKDAAESSGGIGVSSLGSTCSEQADRGTKACRPWVRFLDFLL